MTDNEIIKIRNFCSKEYKKETFDHVMRVAQYSISNPISILIEKDVNKMNKLYVIAMLHDYFEDVIKFKNFTNEDDVNNFYKKAKSILVKLIPNENDSDLDEIITALMYLTKGEDEAYLHYISILRSNENIYAYIVKIADMKDHLKQKETLTTKLKDKYLEALPYLL